MPAKIRAVFNVVVKGQKDLAQLEGSVMRFSNNTKLAMAKAAVAVGTFAAAAAGLVKTTQMFYKTGVEALRLNNRLKAAMPVSALYGDALKYVKDEAERLGLRIQDVQDGFAGFSAAALRAGLTMGQTKQIFSDVSEAAVSMQLESSRVSLVFKALEQMSSKGVVSMEELRRQLGDSLPGALQIGAKAMGVANEEFIQMVSTGKVISSEFLPKFAAQIKEELGGSFAQASRQITSSMNRLNNKWYQYKATVAETVIPILNAALLEMLSYFDDDTIQRWADRSAKAFLALAQNLSFTILLLREAINAAQTLWSVLSGATKSTAATVTMPAKMLGKIITAPQDAVKELIKNKGDVLSAAKEFGAGFVGPLMDIVDPLQDVKNKTKKELGDMQQAWEDFAEQQKKLGRKLYEIDNPLAETLRQREETKEARKLLDGVAKAQQEKKKATEAAYTPGAGMLGVGGGSKSLSDQTLELVRGGKSFEEGELMGPWARMAELRDKMRVKNNEFLQSMYGGEVDKIKENMDKIAEMHKEFGAEMSTFWDQQAERNIERERIEQEGKLKAKQAAAQGAMSIAHSLTQATIKDAKDRAKADLILTLASGATTSILAWKESFAARDGANYYERLARAIATSAAATSATIAAAAAVSQAENAYANGTLSSAGGMALVGERGPELVNLPTGSQVFTAGQTQRMITNNDNSIGGVTFNINDQVTGQSLIRALKSGELRYFVSDLKNAMAVV